MPHSKWQINYVGTHVFKLRNFVLMCLSYHERKTFLGITIIISNENKSNSTVDCSRLTRFSTSCLMWLEQSYCTVIPNPYKRFALAHNWIFQCIRLTSELYFPVLKAVTYTLNQTMVPPFVWHETLFFYLWNPHYGSLKLMVSWLTALQVRQFSTSCAWNLF